MKKHYIILLLSVVCSSFASYAQLVGTNFFLQGRYVEIGQLNNGSFGACTSIAGYHPHMPATGVGTTLAEVYDYGHDGWAVGGPQFMGDYTYPGYPFEGWELQIGAARTQAFQGCPAGSYLTGGGGVGLTGANNTYTNAGGRCKGLWIGSASGGSLQIRQETRVDTLASNVVVTTVFVNTAPTATAPIYYMRSTDPDNDQTWPGGGFFTYNTIVHQNEDARHRVMVSSRGNTGPISYMALGTKDCRARCCIYNAWPLTATQDLSALWNGTYGVATYALGGTANGDIGIALTYNLGSIPAGDSTIISYAYIWNGDLGIDSAFPDPQIVINGVPKISWAPPTPNYDTFDACLYPGLTSIPVDILNAEDKDWSWSKWTWSPGTGLATTTGVHNTINLVGLPPMITYTITGTDSATGMKSCHNKVFYLTILTCNNAVANNPCVGDTLFLNAPGDSVGATYQWYGPAPSTAVFATTQAYSIYPATTAHTGTYTVIKTVGGIPDTSTVDVTVYANPVVTAASNQPICGPIVDPLLLTCTTDSVCTAWLWTGPAGFTSGLQNATVTPFDSSKQGTYTVSVVSTHGCPGTGSVLVKPGPVANFTFTAIPWCPHDSVAVVNTSVHGATFEWDWNDGTKSFDRNPAIHEYMASPSGTKIYNIKLTATAGNGCVDSKTIAVDLRHTVNADFDFADDTICNTPSTPVTIIDLSTSSKFGTPVTTFGSHLWTYQEPGGHTDLTNGSPADFTFPNEGVYNVKLDLYDLLNCHSEVTKTVYVLQPYIHSIYDSTFCLTMPLKLWSDVHVETVDPEEGYNFLWTPATALSADNIQEPYFTGVGDFTYTLTATMQHEGCVGTHVMNLHSTLPKQILNLTDDTKINYGESIQLNSENTLHYYWSPNDGSLNNPNINNPIATPTVTTTYMVVGMDFYGCRDTGYVTVVVDSSADEFVPTGFTPNGDGLNDVFRLRGSKFHHMVEFRIYNRWGQQVFYTDVLNKGWDGTYQGKPADMGVYHYTVIVARPGHDHNEVIKGEVTLIR